MRARDYRAIGRAALSGNWGTAILVALVAGILGGSASGGGGGSSVSFTASSAGNAVNQSDFFYRYIPNFIFTFFATFAIFFSLWVLLVFLFGGAATLGACQFNVDLVTKLQPARFSTLFSRFSIFGRALLLRLLIGLFIVLWALLTLIPTLFFGAYLAFNGFFQPWIFLLFIVLLLLFSIPAFMAGFSYSMAGYIMAQNPGVGALEAIRTSKTLMRGNRWRLFCLHLSFFGWGFLCLLTAGIGFLFLSPYINASVAAFYLDLSHQLPGAPSYQPQAAPPYPPPYPGGQAGGYPPPYAGSYAQPQAPGYGYAPQPGYAPPPQGYAPGAYAPQPGYAPPPQPQPGYAPQAPYPQQQPGASVPPPAPPPSSEDV